jgi:5-formyltetrahydrofolate cyclo-ligase
VSLDERKRALRRDMRARREALADDDRRARSAAACAHLLARPELDAGHVAGRAVAGYVAVRGEIDPAAALAGLRARGAAIALPRVSAQGQGQGQRLRFHLVSADAALRPGAYGLPEPDAAAPEVALAALAALVVPGVAFDAAGRRLGFGGGYYDGVLGAARAAGAIAIGLAYDFQIVDACPAGPGDAGVDAVVTDVRDFPGTR